jgi:hypothetical protein
MGSNVDGKPRRLLSYIGGVGDIIIADATKSPHRVTQALKWPEVE